MAKVKRSVARKKGDKKTLKKSSVFRPSVSIPSMPSKISTRFSDYSFLIHGEKKIGKTTLLAQEEDAFFLCCDPLQRSLSIRQRHVPDWEHMLAYILLLEKGNFKKPIKTVIIDGADIAYHLCFDWCCRKLVINHPNDEDDFGKSWQFIRREFDSAILRLHCIPGIAPRFISHSKWAETKTRSGGKVERLIPNLTGQAEEILNGRVDIWGAYVYDGSNRILVIRGNEQVGAGHRVDSQFRTPEGEPVEEIYMGKSPQQAYANLIDAFRNKQTYISFDELEQPKKKRAKRKTKRKKAKVKKL